MPSKPVPPFQRLMRRVDKRADGCWQFTGRLNPDGYSRVHLGRGKPGVQGHRLAYEVLMGPVPDGLDLDHLCRNRGCVNPAHLEPVTRQVNLLRGQTITASKAQQTHCIHGHAFTPENTYIKRNGTRQCRACDAIRAAHRRARKKAEAS